jgi:hypothetical protein
MIDKMNKNYFHFRIKFFFFTQKYIILNFKSFIIKSK